MAEFESVIREAVLAGNVAASMARVVGRAFRADAQILEGVSIQIARDPREREGGVLYSLPGTIGKIVTNEMYPQSLVDEADLDRATALKLAAASVISLTWWDELFKAVPHYSVGVLVRTVSRDNWLPSYPQVWAGDCYTPGRQTLTTAAHRAAAGMALIATDLNDFDTVQKPPLPIHIAALADPLVDPNILRDLYELSYANKK